MIKVKLTGEKELFNMTEEERECIKNELTLDNPAYEQVKRFSRYKYTNVEPYLTYFKVAGDKLIVPRGYKIPFPYEVVEDKRLEVDTLYPKIRIELRDSQEKAYNDWIKDTDKGMLVLATGKGKSILGSYLGYAVRQKTLIIVPKVDLIDGWTKDMEMAFGLKKDKIGVIRAQRYKIGKQFTLATIQTLSKLDKEKKEELYNTFGMVITDECLVGDTLIAKGDGGLIPINEVKNGDKLVGGKVSNKFNRESVVWRVESQHTTIEGSPTHPTFIVPKAVIESRNKHHGRKKFHKEDLVVVPFKDIIEGDYLPVIKQVPHTTKNSWTPEQLAFIALIQADGHLDRDFNRIKVNVTPKDEEYIFDVFYRGVKSFNIKDEVKHNRDCRGNLTIWVNSKELKDILENTFSIGRGKKSNTIKANGEIQYAPLDSIKMYIETLFNCDGDLTADRDNNCRINYNTTSKYMAITLSHLLKKFGIISNYQEIKREAKVHNTVYRLVIGGADFNRFYDTFKMIPRKSNNYRNVKLIKLGYEFDNYRLMKVKKSFLTDRVETVYDYTTTQHNFIANGILTHNCHRVSANSYTMLNHFKAKYVVGLTATDMRNDGLDKVMYWTIGDVGHRSLEQADDEDIMNYTVKIRKSSLTYNPPAEFYYGNQVVDADRAMELKASGKHVKRKPLDPQELRALLRDKGFNNLVARDIYKEYKNSKSCIAFLHEKEHIRELRDILIEIGVPQAQIQLYYGDAVEDDSVMKEKAESKEVLVTLATFSKATEGTNVKSWERAFLVTSINNVKNTIQAVGRCRRRKEGKEDVIVYDYTHPNVMGMKNHIKTRMKAYKMNLATIEGSSEDNKDKGRVTRGWKMK